MVNLSHTELVQRESPTVFTVQKDMPVGLQIHEAFPSKGLKAGDAKASKIQSPQLLSFDDVTEDISFPAESCLPLVYRFSAVVAPL